MRRAARLAIAAAALAAVLSSTGCSILNVPTDQLLAPPKPTGANASAPPKVVAASNTTTQNIEAAEPAPIIKSVSSSEATALVAQGATLVDLRGAKAFKKEHIDGATNVPMSTFAKKAKDWPQDAPVVLCCDNGYQSRSARSWLARRGFSRVYDIKGGLDAWQGELVGKDVRRRLDKPKFYYFHSTFWEELTQPELVEAWSGLQGAIKTDLKGKVEFIEVDVTGIEMLKEYELTNLPTWRLVDRDGNSKAWIGHADLGPMHPTVKRVAEGGSLR